MFFFSRSGPYAQQRLALWPWRPAADQQPCPPLRPGCLQHYVKTNGGLKPLEALGSYIGAVPDHFKWGGPEGPGVVACRPSSAAVRAH